MLNLYRRHQPPCRYRSRRYRTCNCPIWVQGSLRSFSRVFREGTYPPLRGTFIELQTTSGLLYLKGSVDFFRTYPGMYVPRPLEFSVHRAETPLPQLASEMLSLSKLNWNNTQFDGGEPITVRAARRVGDILKCVADNGAVQPTFRLFM